MNGQRLESVPMDGEMRRLIKRVKSIQVGGKPATVSWLAEQTGLSRNSVYAFLRGNIRRVQIVEAFRQLADKHAPEHATRAPLSDRDYAEAVANRLRDIAGRPDAGLSGVG